MALRSLILVSKEMRSLLKNNMDTRWIRRQEKSHLSPIGGGFGSLFKMQTIMDNWETIPVVVTGFVAASFPIIHTIWRFMNAEDIRFIPGGKMKNQTHKYILQGPPKPTKYRVINEKWEWPEGLVEAIKQEETSPCKKKVCFRHREKSHLSPIGGGLGSLFHMQTIKDNWETIPVFVTAFFAAMLPLVHAYFHAIRVEDIRYWPGSKMKNQLHSYILEGPPKPTKYMVINEKWEWPSGLLAALRDDKKSSNKCPKGMKRVSFKFWK